MYLIQNLTSDSVQSMNLTLPDGTQLSMTIRFVPMQYSWVITTLTYQSFTLNGFKIINSPNMLRQWKNVIPFGLACYATDTRDPSLQQDFSTAHNSLYILSAEEVAQVEQLFTGVPIWNSINSYALGFLVTYNGKTYSSLVAQNNGNNPATATADWAPYA